HRDPPLRRSNGQSQAKDVGEGLRRLIEMTGQILPVDVMEQLQQIALYTGTLARHQLVQHHPQGEHVAGRRRRLAAGLLRRERREQERQRGDRKQAVLERMADLHAKLRKPPAPSLVPTNSLNRSARTAWAASGWPSRPSRSSASSPSSRRVE